MAAQRNVSPFQAMMAVGVFGVMVSFAYGVLLLLTGQHLSYQQTLLGSWAYLVPDIAVPYLRADSYVGTLVATTLSALHAGGAAVATAWGIAAAGRWWLQRHQCAHSAQRHPITEADVARPQLKGDPQGYYLLQPTRRAEPTLRVGTVTIRGVMPKVVMRLDRDEGLQLSREPRTPEERFEAALLRTLHAHRQWPADPQGHHADTSLYDHSLTIAQRMAEAVPDEPLARSIGLAHDIGKLSAYAPDGESDGAPRWRRRSLQHDRLGAYIVSLFPEYRGLDDDAQRTVRAVLKYAHNPEELPQDLATERTRSLLGTLRRIDGLVTREEVAEDDNLLDDMTLIAKLGEAIEKTLPQLNINDCYRLGGNPDGFTTEVTPFVAVAEAAIRDRVRGALPESLIQRLALRVKAVRGTGHRATPVILEALRQNGLLIEHYRGEQPERGLFQLRVGIKTWSNMFLLDKDAVERVAPDEVSKWGSSSHRLKVTRSPTETGSSE